MRVFADLLDRLAVTPGDASRLVLLERHFRAVPDLGRGFALAALTGGMARRPVTPALLKALVAERVDDELFALSLGFVGDLAETVALVWPGRAARAVPLAEVVEGLARAGKAEVPGLLAGWLDALDPVARLALLRLAGGLKPPVPVLLVLAGLARAGGVPVEAVQEYWSGLSPPYRSLFRWLDGGPPPRVTAPARFRPMMLPAIAAHEDLAGRDPAAYAAEWKQDGFRVLAVAEAGRARLYSRMGEDISTAFPDIVSLMRFDGALDGVLMVRRDGLVAPVAELHKRLGRKAPGRALLASHPAALRFHDVLIWQGEDLRPQPWTERRARLEAAVAELAEPRFDLSRRLDFADWRTLGALRADPPGAGIEGVVLKRRDSPYVAGRPAGDWLVWPRDARIVRAVLLYAQRGQGMHAGFHAELTFGLWQGEALVPVGKAIAELDDAERARLDAFVRANTVERFGPVRSVVPSLVVTLAFEGLDRSTRHKSGLVLRAPRIAGILWDQPAAEAEALGALTRLLPEGGA